MHYGEEVDGSLWTNTKRESLEKWLPYIVVGTTEKTDDIIILGDIDFQGLHG